jgi:hypothetical protein
MISVPCQIIYVLYALTELATSDVLSLFDLDSETTSVIEICSLISVIQLRSF